MVEPEDGVGVGVVADGVGVLVVTSALGDDVASLGGSTSAMCRPVTPINGRCEDLGVIGDEARIVDAFCAWLEAQGWTTQREIEFVDIAASRVISVYMQRRRGARVPCGYIERRTGLLGPDLRGRLRPQPGPAIPNLIRELDALDPAAGVLDLGESWTHSSTALSRQP